MEARRFVERARTSRRPQDHRHRTRGASLELSRNDDDGRHYCHDGNDRNDWWDWESLLGTIEGGVRSGAACHSWERWAEDLDLIHGLGLNAYRLSIEWSRLFPTATDGVTGHDALKAAASPKALAYYHALFAALHKVPEGQRAVLLQRPLKSAEIGVVLRARHL